MYQIGSGEDASDEEEPASRDEEFRPRMTRLELDDLI
jgi:hypothetical protein